MLAVGTWYFVIFGILLVALIVLWVVIRKKQGQQ
jgi:LPXTG-motif cell wall-anchored protein